MPKTKNQVRKRRTTNRGLSRPANPTFGAVSTINTAPVAIGNSMRGTRAQVVHTTRDQVRVVGRDFAATTANTGTVTTWLPAAGIPLTPVCFISSTLRNYCQMYSKFKFNKVRIHYITSSPTSSSGDIMFQYNANRSDPHPNYNSTAFLPYALSKPETIIGPQWTNHTFEFVPKGPKKIIDIANGIDIDQRAQGEIMFYSKTSSTDSPGYLLIDYDVTFYEMAVNPKTGVIPNPLTLYTPQQLVWNTTAYTSGSTATQVTLGSRAVGYQAITNVTVSSYFKPGDIFKVLINATDTNSTAWTVTAGTKPTLNNLLLQVLNGYSSTGISLVDGYTLYATVMDSGNVALYPSMADAQTDSQQLFAGQTFTAATYGESAGVPNAGIWLFCSFSLVGSANPNTFQQQ